MDQFKFSPLPMSAIERSELASRIDVSEPHEGRRIASLLMHPAEDGFSDCIVAPTGFGVEYNGEDDDEGAGVYVLVGPSAPPWTAYATTGYVNLRELHDEVARGGYVPDVTYWSGVCRRIVEHANAALQVASAGVALAAVREVVHACDSSERTLDLVRSLLPIEPTEVTS